jgi:hypothetical protein
LELIRLKTIVFNFGNVLVDFKFNCRGAVALDGRIEPGDMILQVNDVNFENMSNDEAVRVLREVVQKPGPIKLVVAKCWDPNPKGYFTIPRTEPVRPIDPGNCGDRFFGGFLFCFV